MGFGKTKGHVGRRTREVSGFFDEADAEAIAGALVAGDEDQLDRLVRDATEQLPEGDDPPVVAQKKKRRLHCGDCECSAGRSVKTCFDQVLLEQPNGEWRWVTTGVKLERCGWLADMWCGAFQAVKAVRRR